MDDRPAARRVRAAAAAVVLVAAVPELAAAGDAECLPAVGTYLMTRQVDPGRPEGRILLSLTSGGHAFFTDSAQGGVGGYQPFSEARGAWRCSPAADGGLAFTALLLDFTFSTGDAPDQLIARIDIEAALDTGSGELAGEAEVSFAPLVADPMDRSVLRNAVGYRFTGRRIEIPAD